MILITGATGFVGQHLVNSIVERFPCDEIRVFARRAPEEKLWPKSVEISIGSFESLSDLDAATCGVNAVIHLAAILEPKPGKIHEMEKINVEGAKNLFLAAARSGTKHFIHLSSSSVYGYPRSEKPYKEDDPKNPATPYGVSKWKAEQELLGIDSRGTVLNILRSPGILWSGKQKTGLSVPKNTFSESRSGITGRYTCPSYSC